MVHYDPNVLKPMNDTGNTSDRRKKQTETPGAKLYYLSHRDVNNGQSRHFLSQITQGSQYNFAAALDQLRGSAQVAMNTSFWLYHHRMIP